MTLSAADRRIIRAVLLQAGVPEREHEAHLAIDCERNGIPQSVLWTYREIYGSFIDKEKRQ